MSSFKTSEIRLLFKTAHTVYHHRGLTIKQAPKTLNHGRILIVTPKKSGNAPQRNLIRRRLKNIFYLEQLFHGPYDWIIIVSHDAIALPFDSLKETLMSFSNKQL